MPIIFDGRCAIKSLIISCPVIRAFTLIFLQMRGVEMEIYMSRLFGTDGVRGIANTELTCDIAHKIGLAAASLIRHEIQRTPKILIGKDTRISGDMLEAAIASGLCSAGAEVITLGVIPTPAVAHLTRKYEADAGVVISASHNSAEYNGIKIFNANGYKLNDEYEDEIEKIVMGERQVSDIPTGDEVGIITRCKSAITDYAEFAKSVLEGNLDGMRIAVDCADGAASETAVRVLCELGAEVFAVHNHPNGLNINKNCGSTHTADFCEYVRNIKVDIGLSFDGDADRLLVVDEKGNLTDGDKIMLICAKEMKEQGRLVRNTLVTTVMTNLGLVLAAKEMGINIVQTKVGDRYVLEEMIKSGYILGGEASGHIIFLNHNTTGDGLVSALCILEIMKSTGKRISELSDVFAPLPQCMINAKVSNKKKYDYNKDKVILEAIQEVEAELGGRGRVLVRASGTEPCVRVMIEGENQSDIEDRAGYLAKLIEGRLN